jgi:hypothetical protein
MSRRRDRPRRREHQTRDQAGEKRYPSPAKRKRIIERRDKLMQKLITALVVHPDDPHRIYRLARQYGPQEVALVLNVIQERSASSQMIGDEAAIYREYRRAFARFGGDRPFLSTREYGELSFEYAMLFGKRKFKRILSRGPSARERELSDLLLSGVNLWEDITPPAVPPRPDDFDAPAAGSYDYPVRALLDWGWDLDGQRIADNARNVAKWRRAVPDLVRMVLDEGLLNGWPGEPSSWAPYHALHMLGHVRAHEAGGQLLALFDLENDWLSDRLAVVWGHMGPQAEPPLWDYVGGSQHVPEKRAVVLLGLAFIAENHRKRRARIVDRLARLLQDASVDDATANAYIVHVLDRLQAVEAADVISEAFEHGKVDESIVAPYDVDFLEWDEDWDEEWEE